MQKFIVYAPTTATRETGEYRTLAPTALDNVYIDDLGQLWIEGEDNPQYDEQNAIPPDFEALVGDEFCLEVVVFQRLRRRGYTSALEPDGECAWCWEVSWGGNLMSDGPRPAVLFNEVMNKEMPLGVVIDKDGRRWKFVKWDTRNLELYGPGVLVERLEGEDYPSHSYGARHEVLDMRVDWAATAKANQEVAA